MNHFFNKENKMKLIKEITESVNYLTEEKDEERVFKTLR